MESMCSIISAMPVLVVVILLLAVVYARHNYGFLEKMKGVASVVTPYFIGGSDPFFYKSIVSTEDTKRVIKYGKVYGFYEGSEKHVYISNVNLIKDIFVRDFDYFPSKRPINYGQPLVNEMLDTLPYEKWKILRTFLSPQLSTAKISGMKQTMLEAVHDFKKELLTNNSENAIVFEPKTAFTSLATDILCRCVFGLKIDTLYSKNSEFLKNFRIMSLDDSTPDFWHSIGHTFPFFASLAPFVVSSNIVEYFGNLLKSVITRRRNATEATQHDFVDALNQLLKKISTPEFKAARITEDTVYAQSMILLVAGIEAAATAMALVCYQLAKHIKVQERVVMELNEYLQKHQGILAVDGIQELNYLRAVIFETMRMNAPLIRLERHCAKDWENKETGLRIQKGMTVQVPVYAVHFDEEYYENATEFLPERFLPENKDKLNPYTFLAFGLGPHNCFGIKFAKDELLISIASLLKDFYIEDLNAKLVYKPGKEFLNSYETFYLKLVRRSNNSESK